VSQKPIGILGNTHFNHYNILHSDGQFQFDGSEQHHWKSDDDDDDDDLPIRWVHFLRNNGLQK